MLFSVIIPHKDCIALLYRAVDSIPDSLDIQILIIDNSISPIPSDLFKRNRKNVEIFYSDPQLGAGGARNTGLRYAKGKWLLFLDADDYYINNAFQLFFAEADSSEIIYFKMNSCYSDSGLRANRDVLFNNLIDFYLKEKNTSEEIVRYKFVSPCAKMVSRELIQRKEIKFDEVIASNDVMFSLYSGYYAFSIKCVDNVVYCATVTKGSLTNRLTLQTLKARYEVVLRYNEFLRLHHKHRYQGSVMYYLLEARKYGIRVCVNFVKLCLYYRNNPFIGMTNWFGTYVNLRKSMKKDKAYITKK